MRITLFVFTYLLSLLLIAEIPQVPTSIEIAGVKLKLTDDAQEEIQKHVNALRASEKYFKIKLDRVNLYFPIVERVLKEEGVPEDIKYLAIQESALISDAVSSSNAVGYWQFKDFTAREVGLRVDSKIDERKNIVSATRGAAKYFKRNNFFFKNWIYSVSAYQAGPGGAKRYVEKENFGSDKLTITKKTHWYVLKFIAHVIAFQDEVGQPHSEGLHLAEYTKGEGKSIDQVAREMKVDEDLAKEYNKWLIHGKVPDDKLYTVLVPLTGKAPNMMASNKSGGRTSTSTISAPKTKYPNRIAGDIISKKQSIFLKVNGIEATMASRDDDVQSLSRKAGIDPGKFLSYNDLSSTATIEAGQIYYVSKKKNRSAIYHHVAQYDESLWEISQKYGIKLEQLKSRNRMDDNETLKPGRLMWLRKKRPADEPIEYHKVERPKERPSKQTTTVVTRKPIEVAIKTEEKKELTDVVGEKKPVKSTEKPEPGTNKPKGDRILHIIQPGETFWSLSKRYEVTVMDIAVWNHMNPKDELAVGEELLIYANRSSEESKPRPSTSKDSDAKPSTLPANSNNIGNIHTVAPGESLWAISQKFDVSVADLRSWNQLSESDPINPGQELIVGKKTTKDRYTTYVVKGGDSLYKISKKFEMTVQEIMEINQMSSTSLSVGDVLKVLKK